MSQTKAIVADPGIARADLQSQDPSNPIQQRNVVKVAVGAVSYTHLTLPTILRV